MFDSQGEDSKDKKDEKENIKKKEVMITFHDVGMNRKSCYVEEMSIMCVMLCFDEQHNGKKATLLAICVVVVAPEAKCFGTTVGDSRAPLFWILNVIVRYRDLNVLLKVLYRGKGMARQLGVYHLSSGLWLFSRLDFTGI